MNIEIFNETMNPTIIKVVGIGGGGCNAINRMIDANIQNVEFLAVNTDIQALSLSKALNKIQIGSKLTKGLGAGSNPDTGEKSALEDREQIFNNLEGSNMIFITTGMGGGTGTGAAPIIAEIAKSTQALVVAVVTTPFTFEGKQRVVKAQKGIQHILQHVDTLITIPNQNLLSLVDKKITFKDAFLMVDDILRQGVQSISDIITVPGIVNVDFADVRAIMQNAGNAMMGIGIGKGEGRASKAADMAMTNPLLEGISIEGAQGVLVNITANSQFSIQEYEEISEMITKHADSNANIIIGTAIENSMDDEIRVTVIATGFNADNVQQKEQQSEQASSADIRFMDVESSPSDNPVYLAGESRRLAISRSTLSERKHETDLERLEIPTFLRMKS